MLVISVYEKLLVNKNKRHFGNFEKATENSPFSLRHEKHFLPPSASAFLMMAL